MIELYDEVSFSEKGKRENNEDNFGSLKGQVYSVCDGVGGHEKGEIASEIVVNTFISKENSQLPLGYTLKLAEDDISNYISANPNSLGMGTTLTVLQIRTNGICVGWVGDSRIYQFRNGEIIFQTKDHSWVNEAIAAGIITEQEGINHPKSNIITRAIQGGQNPTKVEEKFLTNIDKDDIFLLCSDGVLETWSNADFEALFSTENELNIIAERIKNECEKLSKDNFTGILLKIKSASVKKSNSTHQTQHGAEAGVFEAIDSSEEGFNQYEPHLLSPDDKNVKLSGKSGLNKKIILFSVVFALLCVGAFFIFLRKDGVAQGKSLIELKIDTLKQGKQIFTDTFVSKDSSHYLYKTRIRFSQESQWEYLDKNKNKWLEIDNDSLLNQIFPGINTKIATPNRDVREIADPKKIESSNPKPPIIDQNKNSNGQVKDKTQESQIISLR